MTEKNRAVLQAVIRTLDSLSVAGSGNMSRVLGCIGALEELLTADGTDVQAREEEDG